MCGPLVEPLSRESLSFCSGANHLGLFTVYFTPFCAISALPWFSSEFTLRVRDQQEFILSPSLRKTANLGRASGRFGGIYAQLRFM
jgi:hypothetical protein